MDRVNSLELRLNVARATRDLDFAAKKDLSIRLQGESQQAELLREKIQDAVTTPIEDSEFDRHFVIIVEEVALDIQGGGGGFRIPIGVFLAQQEVAKFHIDITVGVCETSSYYDFLPMRKCAMIDDSYLLLEAECVNSSQFFADKIHAYTKPRETDNTRTKDIVDLFLLISSGYLNQEQVAADVRSVFAFENTHSIPTVLPPPPQFWQKRFVELARECKLSIQMDEAFASIKNFWNELQRWIVDDGEKGVALTQMAKVRVE